MSAMDSVMKALTFHDVRVVDIESVTQTNVKASAKGIAHDVPVFDDHGNVIGSRTVRFDGNTSSHNLRTHSTVRGLVGICYSWLVNMARVKAGQPFDPATGKVEQFVALPTWGDPCTTVAGERLPWVRYDDGPLGPFYLPVSPTGVLSMRYVIDGVAIPDATVAPHRRSSGPSKRQGLDASTGVLWRKFSLRNVAGVKVGSVIAEGPARELALALCKIDEDGKPIDTGLWPDADATIRRIADAFAPRTGEGVDG